MLRSFPKNPPFRPSILGQQASINHKIVSHCVTSVIEMTVGTAQFAGRSVRPHDAEYARKQIYKWRRYKG